MTVRDRRSDALYFDWLYAKVGIAKDRNPSHSHYMLVEQLHRRLFLWSVPNDDNRIYDGLSLRDEFVREMDCADDPPSGLFESCSVLEVLIAIARRVEFETTGTDIDLGFEEWFWKLLGNLGLDHLNDELYCGEEGVHDHVDQVIDIFVERLYGPDGKGGLFPLDDPKEDQREVELWYQMAAYLQEQSGFWSE